MLRARSNAPSSAAALTHTETDNEFRSSRLSRHQATYSTCIIIRYRRCRRRKLSDSRGSARVAMPGVKFLDGFEETRDATEYQCGEACLTHTHIGRRSGESDRPIDFPRAGFGDNVLLVLPSTLALK